MSVKQKMGFNLLGPLRALRQLNCVSLLIGFNGINQICRIFLHLTDTQPQANSIPAEKEKCDSRCETVDVRQGTEVVRLET